ncbi:L-lactate dehydrogenase [Sphingomonas canadensis]|uniref:L-lactate dehydrogenase n=1 Tax=Sphingomonas canadensis TaxID=1219257 RepID=A0ABW3HH73_9SPHN|nr:L-lactate dehydrogenase [Sphingomonas canadensis]MCW3838349.1 L-lactate dehydrogenase [Sphingomonas canadensis]
MNPASFDDYRELARRRLPRMFFEYVDGGSFNETTLRSNSDDLAAVKLRQRVLVDTSAVNTAISVFGQCMSMPVGLAPVGVAGLFARRGEVQAARAAKVAGVPMCLSTIGICSVEEVSAAAAPPWFQLYMLKDRGYMRELLARARTAGSPVLLFTVDMAATGGRYRDYRNGGIVANNGGMAWAERMRQGMLRPRWSWDVFCRGRPLLPGNLAAALPEDASINDALVWVGGNMDRTVSWKDLDFVRENWDGPLVLKGILDPEDARSAAKAGVDGIVVSNHGGRQLDGVSSSIAALPRVADAAGGLEIFLDSGVRNGLDVLRALAMGARAVFLGRAWAWALAAGGEAMVARMLGSIRAELTAAMILSGCTDVAHATRDLIDGPPRG